MSPALLGLLGAFVILVVVGFARALTEYGSAGLVAWCKLLLGPFVIAIWCIVILPGDPKEHGLRVLFPSGGTLRVIFIGVAVVTAAALISAATLGVGWIVSK
jgi:hypothetical protein